MDETKMTAFVERAVGDVGALLGGALVVIGDKLGLYRAMVRRRADDADRTGRPNRYRGAVRA